MAIDQTNEKRFEQDIESSLLHYGGYTNTSDVYDPKLGVYKQTLTDFIKATQPKEWARFVMQNKIDPEKKFCIAFNNASDRDGLISVLRHGFKHRGITFHVCYFKPESRLNRTAQKLYDANVINVVRQWRYSAVNNNSVDMMLAVNGIPVFAFELKNQYTGQDVENSKRQWMYDRDPSEICFQFNKRILGYFAVDQTEVWMTTKLAKGDTYFLPFNQGSNGAGNDGGAGNPPNPNGYPTAYLWENVFTKDSMMDVIKKFIHLEVKTDKTVDKHGNEKVVKKQNLIFPRFHQLDCVRKLIADVSANGAGHNYLIQHSAGSGKSNSIAWTAYRLASLHDIDDNAIFKSVIVVTDRTVLDAQLQNTISCFDHTIGSVETIGEGKSSQDLKNAINDGKRIIVTTLQKFPVIYQEVDKADGKNYAVIVDEAHSSQTGSAAMKLKTALADTEEALREYAEYEAIEEEKFDPDNKLIQELISHGKHKNLSFFAFTATPKDKTLEMFGTEYPDGSYHPFHIYSMKQAIEEGFILDVLQNYMTYDTCFKIANTTRENPDVPSSKAAKVIRKFEELHPYNISQKTPIIVETFREVTRHKIGGKGKMMVVASSRPAAVKYYFAVKDYIEKNGYDDVDVLVAFSGSVPENGDEYTESKLNKRRDGSAISESQTKEEFHDNFGMLIVAEKFQTGFDEPYLHTMIVDKKLKGVKAVQTLSRLNRTCPGKNDTLIIDFINTADDITEAFNPFYQETYLEQEVNADLIYQTQRELRNFKVYDDTDIEKFADEYYKPGKQDDRSMGKMTSILKPVADRYNTLDPDDRYQFRRQLRSLIRWYGYISQVVRMFDADLHKEYVFCSYLLKLLPVETVKMVDIENKLKLEYYKLNKTFEGSISLEDGKGVYEPPQSKSAMGLDPLKPLDEVIEKINEKFAGQLTEGDKVLISNLYPIFTADDKLMKIASTSDRQIFGQSIFPKAFGEAAQNSYVEAQETYESLFEDESKYNAIMSVLADAVFKEAARIAAGGR